MSNLALILTLVFVLITILASMWRKLGLEKDIAWGTVRGSIQLFLVGYVLHFVFQSEHILLTLLIIGIMIVVAAWNAAKRGKGVQGILWRIIIAISVMEIITMSLLIGLQIIEPIPKYMIPLTGVLMGNAMVVSGLFLNQMNREIQSSRGEIETLLSYGATALQAIQVSLKRSVKTSMIPTIDNMKTVGLVQLPGMMTGMIVAGADPIQAVRYQILIMLITSASAAITSIVLSMLSYRLWFTKDLRLRPVK
ncbi:iron export ABC transporter permease subunit FetB [Paenibacillus filicis]|uniref:Iron export ABC transporter permease subunit FetB n=1 Tax=Paenibacillus gyeongsangnamensis TaxID=3388067 RepID=A0ABT4QGB0_9BACL|nr:iron export ABC transporter permease subunit FetB [Paenibacillus filicis]MCZ8515848.1 iron export ABC transporter permease subunit FetB [Paenibacillus filicis]